MWQINENINKIIIFATKKLILPNKNMNKIIAHNFKKLREAAGYTQNDVANALGLKRSAYSNYELGDREIPYDIIEKASNFFGCDMECLFEENENINATLLVSAFRTTGLSQTDAIEVMRFTDIVKSYLKMERLASR